jgi:hypothetical protein
LWVCALGWSSGRGSRFEAIGKARAAGRCAPGTLALARVRAWERARSGSGAHVG